MSSIKKCSISLCRSRQKKKKLFSIPYEDEELFEKWKQNLPNGIDFEETTNEVFFVCQDHFEDNLLIINQADNTCELVEGAVPTIFNSTAEKNKSFLIDHSNNCRFCLKQISNNEEYEDLSDNIIKLFCNVTNFEVSFLSFNLKIKLKKKNVFSNI